MMYSDGDMDTIEDQLIKLCGWNTDVLIVRPVHLNISDSWMGKLYKIDTLELTEANLPKKFHFTTNGFAMIFTTTDVESIDNNKVNKYPVIRLKGPNWRA